jgi:hypothetical protein
MQPAKPHPRDAESEIAVWVLIVILFALSSYAMLSLLVRVSG